MQPEERYRLRPLMLKQFKFFQTMIKKEKNTIIQEANSVTVFSSADSISFTLEPTFSIMPAPFS